MAALLLHRKSKLSLTHITEKLFHTEVGCTIVSAIFGVAVAFMFQRVCKGANCMLYKSPPEKEIKDIVYEIPGDSCYIYKPKVVKCT